MLKLTTTVYKYKRYAAWLIGGFAVFTVIFFMVSPQLNPLFTLVGIILLVVMVLYGAIRPASVFSIRSVDQRKLIFTSDALQWGTWVMPIHEIEQLDVFIHAFDTFRHRTGQERRANTFTTEYGDRNSLTFTYRGLQYELTFFLGNFMHYETLLEIMQSWRDAGINFSVRWAFSDEYIRKNVALNG